METRKLKLSSVSPEGQVRFFGAGEPGFVALEMGRTHWEWIDAPLEIELTIAPVSRAN